MYVHTSLLVLSAVVLDDILQRPVQGQVAMFVHQVSHGATVQEVLHAVGGALLGCQVQHLLTFLGDDFIQRYVIPGDILLKFTVIVILNVFLYFLNIISIQIGHWTFVTLLTCGHK